MPSKYNNEIKGETYVVKADYRGDELENIKLVSPEAMTRQVGFLERRDNQ